MNAVNPIASVFFGDPFFSCPDRPTTLQSHNLVSEACRRGSTSPIVLTPYQLWLLPALCRRCECATTTIILD